MQEHYSSSHLQHSSLLSMAQDGGLLKRLSQAERLRLAGLQVRLTLWWPQRAAGLLAWADLDMRLSVDDTYAHDLASHPALQNALGSTLCAGRSAMLWSRCAWRTMILASYVEGVRGRPSKAHRVWLLDLLQRCLQAIYESQDLVGGDAQNVRIGNLSGIAARLVPLLDLHLSAYQQLAGGKVRAQWQQQSRGATPDLALA